MKPAEKATVSEMTKAEFMHLIRNAVEQTITHMQTLQTGEALMKPKEVAAMLRISVETIEKWMRMGILPYYRMGKRAVFLKKSEIFTSLSPVIPANRGKGPERV